MFGTAMSCPPIGMTHHSSGGAAALQDVRLAALPVLELVNAGTRQGLAAALEAEISTVRAYTPAL